MHTFYIAAFLLSCLISFSQKTVDVNNTAGVSVYQYYTTSGVPFVNTKYVNIIGGSPYLTDHWLKGRVVGTNGQRYSGALLKLDLLNNQLHFLNRAGTELIAQITAKEMWLEDTLLSTTYHLVNKSTLPSTNNNKSDWYELLDTGKVDLYKLRYKLLSETLPYGASTHEQRIITKERYYVRINKLLFNVNSYKDLPTYLTDRKADVEAYLKKQDKEEELSVEERWRNAIRYYNTL